VLNQKSHITLILVISLQAEPSIVTWRGPAKGTKGESTKLGDLGSKQIVNRNWKQFNLL
jgi:hypothetical protein